MSQAIIDAFNNAADWAATLAAIKDNSGDLLDQDHLDKLNTLPDGGGREKAIGLGVLEIKTLFGNFTTIEDVQAAVDMQIDVEYAKYEFITALDAATTAAEMTDAILDTIELVNQDRQDLIEAWSNSGDADAVARATDLADDAFTTVLAEIVSHLGEPAYMAELGARMLALRNDLQGGKFFGDGKIIAALEEADAEIEAEHLATITGDFTGTLDEDGIAQVVFGTLSVQDEDWGEDVFQAVDAADLQKTYGTFAFDHETGAWTFTLNNDAAQSLKEGEEVEQTLTVTSFDGTAEETITITVTGVNDDPTAATTGNSVSGTVNTTITGNVPVGSDVDGDALTYELVAPVAGLTLNANGSFSYEPADDFTGNVTFQYKAKDSNGGTSAAQTFTITVTQPNRAPVAATTGNSASGDEDKILIGELPDATDADGDDLTYELVAPVAGLTLNADGTFSYAPAADFNGEVTFQYRAVDEHGEKSEPQTFTLTVKRVNDAPRNVSLSSAKIEENATAGKEVGKLTVSDPEGGSFTYELVDNAGGRFTIDATGTLKVADGVKLDYEQAMSHTVKVRVKDAAGATFEKSFTINVTDIGAEIVTGTATADMLTGGSGKDTFKGGAGDDKLSGGADNDTLWGEKGKDVFVFDTALGTSSTDRKVNFDTIKDFSVRDDSIQLDNAIFKKLVKVGKLNKNYFTTGDKAKDKNDYVVYNSKTGVLSYDADGSGKGKAVEFAQLSRNLKMTEKDFFVI
ncbi:Ig-like domain-containing protein [Microvirga sp. CF3016]|uniref:Ig-like domain-containing protein n=1 Tax=Microvirga sp. CF3016 TaxID=3110181 RepID=UPI002E7972D0|nr:Ig-like domain-containing protein [Microvirga sp. CF3016]MEE1613861.1 Ig-like domain-containing protein [Microvirga sp. CF3016]